MLKAACGSKVWLGMLLAGLALSAYVFAAWPDTTTHPTRLPSGEAMPKAPAAKAREVRRTAAVRSASADTESELSGVLAELYPLELYFYEVSAAPLLDALIAAPQPADAN
jgi:hypothetical protein